MLYLVTAALSLAAPAIQEVHPDRAAQIVEINNAQGATWKASAHPRFATEAPGASQAANGVKGSWKIALEEGVKKGELFRHTTSSNALAPTAFDSELAWPNCAKVIGDIRDQSNCGCCWAFAGAEAASDRMCISTNATLAQPLSSQETCFCSESSGCNGGQIDTPWHYIQNEGVVTGGQYQGTGPFGADMCSDFSLPHCHHHGPQGSDPYPAEGQPGCPATPVSPQCPTKCDSDSSKDFESDKYTFKGQTETASGEEGIMSMIMEGGPVETAFTVYTDFENYDGGIYHHVTGGRAGGHAVRMVGWGIEDGTKYWKVANSWNPYWGEKGYFRIVKGTNEGGIEDMVIGSSADAVWGKKN